MFLPKRRRKPAPPFLEGTFGTYVRRESPPRIPQSTPMAKSSSQSTKSLAQTSSSKNAYSSNTNTSQTNLDQQPQMTSHNLGSLTIQQQQQKQLPTPQKSLRPTHPLSSHSFSDPSKNVNVHKKSPQTLTTSLSIGNFDHYEVDHGFELLHHQEILKGGSLQSITGRMPGSSILDDRISMGTPEADLPLPENWAVEVTPDGYRYYVDHTNQRTHWIHPLAQENLPPGWTKIFDTQYGVVYYNEIEKRSQYEHPGLATTIPNLATIRESSSLQSLVDDEHPNEVEDLNIIKEEIPSWLQMYSMAPFESDHLLNFKLFKLHQLEKFDQMLLKLFKQDAINIVRKYERPRREINWELARRQFPQHMYF